MAQQWIREVDETLSNWNGLTHQEKQFSVRAVARLCDQASAHLLHVAELLGGMAATSEVEPSPLDERVVARRIIAERKVRNGCLHPHFPEAAWHILLDLHLADLEQRRVTVSDACLAAGIPTTTALRHINMATSRGLISRQPHLLDARVIRLKLTEEGRSIVRKYLQSISALRSQP